MSLSQQVFLWTGAAAMLSLLAYKYSEAQRARAAADDAVAAKIALIRENWSIGEFGIEQPVNMI
jgi:hypothetical protein